MAEQPTTDGGGTPPQQPPKQAGFDSPVPVITPGGAPAPAPAPQQPAAPTPETIPAEDQMKASVGVTKAGGQVLPNDPEVQKMVSQGLSIDAAIGNVVMAKNKEQPETEGATPTAAADVAPGSELAEQFGPSQPGAPGTSAGPSIPSSVSDGYAELEAEEMQIREMYDGMSKTLDAQNKGLVDSIKANYAGRRKSMQEINRARLGSMTKAGFRAGRARYAPEIETSILSNEERAGIGRLQELDREEAQLIQAAQKAASEQQFGLLSEQMNQLRINRGEKERMLVSQHQAAVAQEELLMKKSQEARNMAKFEMDVVAFQDEMQQNNFDRALSVAKNNGYNVGFDQEGNLDIIPELTFENSLKADTFKLSVDKFGFDQTMGNFKNQMEEKGFALDSAKFQQQVDEFGMDYAIKEANFNLQQQQHYQDRSKDGFGTTYDQLGMLAPQSKVDQAYGQAMYNVAQDYIGTNGGIRPKYGQTGWECAEWAEQLVDLGTPGNRMGSLLRDKKNTIAKHGYSAAQIRDMPGGFAVGDVIVTNGGDVAGGKTTKYGHVMIVGGKNSDGSLQLLEANRKNQGKIYSDRTLSADSPYIVGAFRGTPKSKVSEQAEQYAAQNLYEATESAAGGAGSQWANAVTSGMIDLNGVPADQKLSVMNELAQSGYQTKAQKQNLSKTTNILTKLDSLFGAEGMEGAVGFGLSKMGIFGGKTDAQGGQIPRTGTKAYDFYAKVQGLKSAISAKEIENLKGLGAMSDTELAVVTNAVGTISLGQTEAGFNETLREIQKVMMSVQSKLSGGGDFSGYLGGQTSTSIDMSAF